MGVLGNKSKKRSISEDGWVLKSYYNQWQKRGYLSHGKSFLDLTLATADVSRKIDAWKVLDQEIFERQSVCLFKLDQNGERSYVGVRLG